MNNKQKIQELIKKLRATDDIEEQDTIKQEIDFLEENKNQIKYYRYLNVYFLEDRTVDRVNLTFTLSVGYNKEKKQL